MIIRRLDPAESETAANIERSCLSVPWSAEQIALHARREHGVYLVCELDGAIRGVCGANLGAGECSVNNIAVAEGYRRRGIARALIKALFEECRARSCGVVYLEVASRNDAAVSLYKSLGFAPYGTRPRFYGDDGAILMKAEVLC